MFGFLMQWLGLHSICTYPCCNNGCRWDFSSYPYRFPVHPGSITTYIGLMGSVMGLYGFCALTQGDIKKILAYSTLSQLGYMAAAFRFRVHGIALFHLMTHAFFKALMFLGSGSVIHACHHEQNIFNYGGLRQKMPLTAYTFLAGVAISGVHFFSGYFSKDAILLGAYNLNSVVFIILYLGAILTSVYMFRLYFLTFCGKPRSKSSSNAHESSVLICWSAYSCGSALSVFGSFHALYPTHLVSFMLRDIQEWVRCPIIYG